MTHITLFDLFLKSPKPPPRPRICPDAAVVDEVRQHGRSWAQIAAETGQKPGAVPLAHARYLAALHQTPTPVRQSDVAIMAMCVGCVRVESDRSLEHPRRFNGIQLAGVGEEPDYLRN